MKRVLLVAAFGVLLLSLLTGVAQVRPGERAVVRRFGRVVATPGPGLWVGLPWGMDRVDRIPIDRVRRVTVGYEPSEDEDGPPAPPGQFLTGDHNLVNVQVVVRYVVDDDAAVAFLEAQDRADDLLARAAETVVTEWVAGQAIDDVLLEGKRLLPGAVVRQTQERIDAYYLGVRVLDADLAYLLPPRDVQPAFDEVTRAQAAIRTREHEARQAALQTVREAETEKYRRETQTEAYVAERVRFAGAEAERFERRLAQYRRLRRENPSFLAGLWWEEMGKLFTRLREGGRIDLLDHHLGPDGLDITVLPPPLKKK